MKQKEFNGYSFDEKKMRKHMKFLVITDGDLDLNEAYAFRTKRSLNKYLKEYKGWKNIEAIFEIKDITTTLPKKRKRLTIN